ncbi:MAG: hypothetical protein R2712_32085, partial [Vicinamibacterales bacterium]
MRRTALAVLLGLTAIAAVAVIVNARQSAEAEAPGPDPVEWTTRSAPPVPSEPVPAVPAGADAVPALSFSL